MAEEAIGTIEQLTPETQQISGPEGQDPRRFGPADQPLLTDISQEERRDPPLEALPTIPLPDTSVIEDWSIRQTIFGVPIARLDRYEGTKQDWVQLLRWDVSWGRQGDLHEISVLSNNDAKTRYQLLLGNVDQEFPVDRQTSTPVNLPWRTTMIPGGTSVVLNVRSTDGTSIIVDGMLTGTER